MRHMAPIKKLPNYWIVEPNLRDYKTTCAHFTWDDVYRSLDGLPDGNGLNIAHEAVDRHAKTSRGNHLAMRWLGAEGEIKDFTYAELREATSRFANVLSGLPVPKGGRVFVMAGRTAHHYIAALGTLKNGCVLSPLFSNFGPEPVYHRLVSGEAQVLVTTTRQYNEKIAGLQGRIPSLEHILLVDAKDHSKEGVWALPKLMAQTSDRFIIPRTDPDDIAILHFTSGTSGMPKGAVHVHEAVVAHYITGKYVFDFHQDDIFWCTADPGWVTGTSYGTISPLLHAITNIVAEADFEDDRWLRILEQQHVSIWYTTPTVIRRLMRLSVPPRDAYDLSRLRCVFSVGEPLDPSAVLWAESALGVPIHDTWWQTETGAVMISNFLSMDVRPGSMGQPIPGVEAAILRPKREGGWEPVESASEHGTLALRAGWPSMFRGYLHDDERYRQCFTDGWYLTGDLAMRDEDGYFWFVGRADDMIKTSGHMVGPFEVESVLTAHPAVAEAAVVGKPNPIIGETVKAFIVLKSGFDPSDNLRLDVLAFARTNLGPSVAPREIEFVKNLPKNDAGKTIRRLLRDREMKQVEGLAS